MTNKDKLELLEAAVVKLSAQVEQLTKQPAVKEPVLAKKYDPNEEMTTEDYFKQKAKKPFIYGDILVDGDGNPTDPNWKVDSNGEMIYVIDGEIEKRIRKDGSIIEYVRRI
jgi:hypothetical protein